MSFSRLSLLLSLESFYYSFYSSTFIEFFLEHLHIVESFLIFVPNPHLNDIIG